MKPRTRKTLFEKIIGGDSVFDDLGKKNDLVNENLHYLRTNYNEVRVSLIENRTTLAYLDGRITPNEYDIANKVLDKAEIVLMRLRDDIKSFESLQVKLEDTLNRIESSRITEGKSLEIEGFLQSERYGSGVPSEGNALSEKDVEAVLLKESKILAHAVDALLELQAGKSYE